MKYEEMLARVVSSLEDHIETNDIILIKRIDALILLEACKNVKRYERKETPCKPVRIYPPFGDNVPIKKFPKIFGCAVCKEQIVKQYNYCPKCGQKLDWKGEF
ncbi:MAG: hypothetical protein ACOYEB_07385 [Enterococcus lemanii]|jgi:hypothetical protein